MADTKHAGVGLPQAETSHAMIAHDHIHGISSVSNPRLSPDGTRAASVVATTDIEANKVMSRIWLDGAALTAGPSDSTPVWSPDGRSLAFVSRRGEKSSDATLHIMPIDGPGEVRQVCAMPDGMSDVAWSPDGRWLAFTSRTQDERYAAKDVSWQAPRKIERYFSRLNGEDWVFDRPSHVYVVAADSTARPRNLTPGEFEHTGVAWLADSSGLITTAARHDAWDIDMATDLYLVGLNGEVTGLTAQTGQYSMASVSPDGTQLAFVGLDNPLMFPQNAAIGVMNIDGSNRRWVSTKLDRTFMSMCSQPPVWLDDATLVAAAEDRGDNHLYRVSVNGSAPEQITGGPITVTGFSAAGGAFARTVTTVDSTAELWRESTDGTSTQVTSLSRTWRSWEKFTVPCADGSDEIDAWIMRPDVAKDGASCPVLLNVHGGPFTQYGESFFDEDQMQAAAGFAVIVSNPRGGSGRHTGWGQAIAGPKHQIVPGTGWGSVDLDDVLSVLDAALATYSFCDSERVGMIGGSYGGYMATMLAAKHGEELKAICS